VEEVADCANKLALNRSAEPLKVNTTSSVQDVLCRKKREGVLMGTGRVWMVTTRRFHTLKLAPSAYTTSWAPKIGFKSNFIF